MGKPVVKVIDVKDKVVIVRILGSQEDVDLNLSLADNYLAAGARSVFFCNHLMHVEAWDDEELKKAGLCRIE